MSPSEQPLRDKAELRPLTVVFCDLADSSQLAESLDPEDLREVVRSYQSAAAAVVQQVGGHIAQYLGDGILVYFGYPDAQENDPLQAVRASLRIPHAIGELSDQLQRSRGITLAVRAGVHTGLVVAGDVGGGDRQERLAMGSTPNIAARLQTFAMPNTVVISEATRRLVEGFFELEPLGEHVLKGRADQMAIYRVVRETGAQTRFDVAMARGLNPAVGRDDQLAFLNERLAKARSGSGQVVLVSGEAGIGKSRLLQLFHEQDHADADWLTSRCAANEQDSALRPIARLLEAVFQFADRDDGETRVRKIADWCAVRSMPAEEAVPLLAPLVSVDPGSAFPPLDLGPAVVKGKTHELLVGLLHSAAADGEAVLAVEDLHWADPSTIQVLTLLTHRIRDTRTMLLCTTRPGFVTPWKTGEHISTVRLDRLERAHVEALISSITRGRSLPAEVVDQLAVKTDGVPLYVEELTKMILESGLVVPRNGHYESAGPPGPLAIPETLHDSLMARLDRLASGKEIAQIGSVLGREFSYELLEAVLGADEQTLELGLDQLVEAQLLFRKGSGRDSTFVFKHALIQDTAYQSLLKKHRRAYHLTIAQRLAEQFPQIAGAQPELLAHHFSEAGQIEQGLRYWQIAFQVALSSAAYPEAVQMIERALSLVEQMPGGPDRDQAELGLRLALGGGYSGLLGYAAPEVQQAFQRAFVLCQRYEGVPHIVQALGGLWAYYFVCAELPRALQLAWQVEKLAQDRGDPARLIDANYCLGVSLTFDGDLQSSRKHLEAASSAHIEGRSVEDDLPGWGLVNIVTSMAFSGSTLWLMGFLDLALDRAERAVVASNEIKHTQTTVYANHYLGWVLQQRGELDRARAPWEEVVSLSVKHGLFFEPLGAFALAWMDSVEKKSSDAIQRMVDAVDRYRATGAGVNLTYLLAHLADALLRNGSVEAAVQYLDEADVALSRSGEKFWAPELARLRGDAASAILADAEAERHYARATTIAEQQKALSLELRTAMSLARLQRRRGKAEEALDRVASVYGRFSEGLMTPELIQAKTLPATYHANEGS